MESGTWWSSALGTTGWRRLRISRRRASVLSCSTGATAWVGDGPDGGGIEDRLGHDEEAIDVVFHASIAAVIERHMKDERLRTALHGQGVIGTLAGPGDAGTAAVHLMHSMGALEGAPGA